MFGVLLAKLISFLFIKGLFVPALIKRLHLTACNNGGDVYPSVPEFPRISVRCQVEQNQKSRKYVSKYTKQKVSEHTDLPGGVRGK